LSEMKRCFDQDYYYDGWPGHLCW